MYGYVIHWYTFTVQKIKPEHHGVFQYVKLAALRNSDISLFHVWFFATQRRKLIFHLLILILRIHSTRKAIFDLIMEIHVSLHS